MVIIWGNRLCGKVDHVPGFYYVKTKFFHLYYVPLIPLGSVLILDGTETDEGYRGVDVPLSMKSVLLAWLRTAAVLGGIALAIASFVHFGEFQRRPEHLPMALLMVVLTLLAVGLGYLAFSLTQAAPHRAAELAEHLGLDPAAVVAHMNGEEMGPPVEEVPQAEPVDDQRP